MIRRSHATATVATISFVAGAIAIAALAGPLDPPAGPVTSSYKTLAEVEPRVAINQTNTPGDNDTSPSTFKITQPGSYYLTGNITLPGGRIGIEIAASDVKIDLGGFHVLNLSLEPAIAVTLSGAKDIGLRNGSLSGFLGINLQGTMVNSAARGGLIENIHISGAGSNGLTTQLGAVVRDCTAVNCITGFFISPHCTVERCVATGNTTGFSIGLGCVVTGCTANENSGVGFGGSSGAAFENCAAYDNGTTGLDAGSDAVVRGCTATANGADGIVVDAGSTVTDCQSSSNAGDGIECRRRCLILNNQCRGNGTNPESAGIHATDGDNRIEGNNCSLLTRGIDVDVGGNIIIRNTCTSNTTNWAVASGNVILVVNAATAGAVNGNAGGVSPGSTDPNANFTY